MMRNHPAVLSFMTSIKPTTNNTAAAVVDPKNWTVPLGVGQHSGKRFTMIERRKFTPEFKAKVVIELLTGAQVAPQRSLILRIRKDIVPRLATLKNCQRRPKDILNPVQRTFWNPDSRTFYFLVDTARRRYVNRRPTGLWNDSTGQFWMNSSASPLARSFTNRLKCCRWI